MKPSSKPWLYELDENYELIDKKKLIVWGDYWQKTFLDLTRQYFLLSRHCMWLPRDGDYRMVFDTPLN